MLILKSKSLKTEIYRKAIHLSSLWMPLLMLLCNRNFCIVLFAVLLAMNFIVEYASYKRISFIGNVFRKLFIKTLRNKEINRTIFIPSGSIYILSAALIVSVCFSAKAAATAMCIALIADSGAALVGKRFGTYRFSNGKSLEGTLTFYICTIPIIIFFFPNASLFLICFTAILATTAEFFENQIGIDDNLSVPLVSGFLLNLIAA